MKKIKLPLEMANGVMVTKSLEELKANWDLEKVVEHFVTGKLTTWLNDRYYTDLAEKVENLPKDGDGRKLQQALCRVFEMPCEELELDVDEIAERKRRQDLLRQYTSDDEVLNNVDKVAFDQEDLADLLDEGVEKIYLCNGKFSVPLIKNINYVGLGKVKVSIASSEICSFEEKGIKFENIEFDESCNNYPDVLWQQAEDLYLRKKHKEAILWFKKLVDINDKRGQYRMSCCYCRGEGVEVDYMKAFYYAELSAKQNYWGGYFRIADQYENGYGVEKNIELAKGNFKKAADLGDVDAMNRLGCLYRGNRRVTTGGDYLEAAVWFAKAIEEGDGEACWNLGNMYSEGQGGLLDYRKSFELYVKGMQRGHLGAKGNVGWSYFTGNGVAQDKIKAKQLIQECVDANPNYEWAQDALKNWPW